MTQDLMLRAAKASLWMEPIALLDYYVKIIAYDKTPLYRKVIFWEQIPPFQAIDTQASPPLAAAAALAAQTQGGKVNVTNIELFDNEFGQWRWFPLDNAFVRLYLPAGAGKWQLRNLQLGLDRSIIYRDPTLVSTEFFTWEDKRPAVDAQNFSDYALTAVRLIFMGYRFVTEAVDSATEAKLKTGQLPCTPIMCSANPYGNS